MQLCPSCGRENAGDANFCANCATPLRAAPTGRQERKLVTVVFCDLVGFTGRTESMDPEDVRALLTPYHSQLRHELERHGGTVEKFIGDAVVAVFGVPATHEDDPERAVRASLAIRDWAREDGEAEVRIGVNTGQALVSLDVDPASGQGMVAGDVINTAARLQTAAPVNGILVGEQTFRSTRDVIVYADRESVDAKGKTAPVPVWTAVEARARVGATAAYQPRTTFVGRERELALLREAFARARDEREPQVVTLVAVPGAGKSRLVYELYRIVDADPEIVSWRQGRCLSYGEGVNFWALAEIVKSETGILDSDTVEVAAEKLSETVAALLYAGDAAWVEQWLRPLVGLGQADRMYDARAEAFPAWRRFLEAIAERGPVVLVVEDLHWADDGLLDFLDELAEWSTGLPLLLVATARPELLARRPDWGGGRTNALTLSLPPLTEVETASLVHDLLDRTVLDAELQRRLLEHAGGNPLYAEEFACILTERGHDEFAIPETVQGIIAARLDALQPAQKRLVQDASTLGTMFWAGAVADLAGIDRAAAEQGLRELDRREFIRRERRSSVEGETEYAFRHGLVRDIAYEQIPRAERGERHQRAARWIASLGRTDDHAELLAHHYLAAIEYTRAAGRDIGALTGPARAALREAGDRALGLAAYRQAIRFFAAALELAVPRSLERAELLFGHGQAQHRLDGTGEEALAEAVRELGDLGQPETAARAALLLSRSAWAHGYGDDIEPWLAQVDQLIKELPDSVVHLEALVVRAGFAMVAGDYERTIALAEQALPRLEKLDRPDLTARLHDLMGCSRCGVGDENGLAEQRRGIDIAREARAVWEMHHAMNNLIVSYSYFGHVREMQEAVVEWQQMFENIGGTQFNHVWLLLARAEADYAVGRWDTALDSVDQFLATLSQGQSHYIEPQALDMRALINIGRGRTADAHADLDRGLEVAERAGDAQTLAPTRTLRAFLHLGERHTAEASAEFDAVLSFGEPVLSVLNSAMPTLAWIAVDLGRGPDLRPLLDGCVFPYWTDIARAIVEGDVVTAANRLAERGHRSSEAYARLRAGGEHAEAALEFYRSVGATRYINEAQSLLDASA